METVITALVLLAVVVLIVIPLVRATRGQASRDASENLEDERIRIAEELRDVQVEGAVGRLGDYDYQMRESYYESRLNTVTQQLEALHEHESGTESES